MVYEQLGLKIDCKREREREACCPMGLLVIIFTNFIGQNFSTYLNRTIIIQTQFLPLAFFLFFSFLWSSLMMKRLKCSGRLLIYFR